MEDNKQTFKIKMYIEQIKRTLTSEEYSKIEKYINGIEKNGEELRKQLQMFE